MNRSKSYATIASTVALLVFLGLAQAGWAQNGVNPLTIFKNYFVTGDYVVAGWVEQSSNGTLATGTISIPDPKNPAQAGLPTQVPTGADIVAAYLYWGTVEGNQSSFAGQRAFFGWKGADGGLNNYPITGTVLGNPSAPASWSSGGCSGSGNGSKTMRTYRADVRPLLPVDTNPGSPTFGANLPNSTYQVQLADSGSNGNTQPNALGATLVIIYRVLNTVPTPAALNAIVLYDGAYAPNNNAPNTYQTMVGFYQPNLNPTAKITHIVANGQPNKSETAYFGATQLISLYTGTFGANSPPFPGLYGGMWDNPTWSVGNLVTGGLAGFDKLETTSVLTSTPNTGCVSWGAMIFSTTVQDSDNDGLLDDWETNKGYTDAVSGNFVALPLADPLTKDIFVEVDYLNNLDGSAGPYLHSHLPKQAALDAVGAIFANQSPPINVHFDVGGVYQGDKYIIANGTGGNSISEGTLLCQDPPVGAALCAFPGQPAIGWKGGFGFVRDTATMPNTNAPLGNFQPGRGQSYHYVLFGHSTGGPRSFWSSYASALPVPTVPKLISIVNSGNTATVTLQTPKVLSPPIPPSMVQVPVYPKPGDCPNALIEGCGDANTGRVTISGSFTPAPFTAGTAPTSFPLNGTYTFSNVSSSENKDHTVTTTTFTITTSGLPSGTTTYNFANEPQLGVAYLGPTSSSGHSDFPGGGDSLVTLGLWGADDVANCQPDPTQPAGPGYCNNQVGTLNVQTGTLLHEMGHSLTLTHGGAYYNDPNNPSLATYEVNCKSNFLSTMNYLFQVRGFVENKGFDYSGQTMPALNEAYPSLNETVGIGNDIFTSASAAHLTRWYSKPNALDTQLQNQTGGRYAKFHCDGTPLTSADVAQVRVDGAVAAGGNFSAPLDWNNDLVEPDAVLSPGVDINYNGLLGDSPFSGFNDWQIVNPIPPSNGVALQQISARADAFGSSGTGGTRSSPPGGGTRSSPPGGGIDDDGGGSGTRSSPPGGGTRSSPPGGGIDVDENTATSTVDAPTGLTCTVQVGNALPCVGPPPPAVQLENGKSVPLTWTPQMSLGQNRRFDVWRAVGSFTTKQQVTANFNKFTDIKTLNGTPPSPTYVDSNVKNGITYTYFVTETNKQGATSGQSDPLAVTIKF